MFLASLIAVMFCMIAFIADGQVPFTTPISLLGTPSHLWTYRLILSGFTAVAALFVYIRCRSGDMHDVILGGVAIGLLVLLQFFPNGARAHDGLASTLMVVTSILSLGIAQRSAKPWLLTATIGSLVACSMLFSESLLVMGLVEGVVLGTAVVAMNVACGVPRLHNPEWVWPSAQIAAATWWWRPGMGAGLCWGVFCLLISGIGGTFPQGGFVAGPVVLVCCSAIGYIAWREEVSFWLRAPLVFGGYALVMFLLGTVGAASLQVQTVVPVVVLMGCSAVVMLFVDLYTS